MPSDVAGLAAYACPMPERGMRLGVDLGGTKIEILALDAGGDERFRKRVATPQGDYTATLDAVAALVRDAESAVGSNTTIGIGMPGSISRATGLLRGSNSVCLPLLVHISIR